MIKISPLKKKIALGMALVSSVFSTGFVSGLDYSAVVISPEAIIRQEKLFDSKEINKLNIGAQVTIKEIIDDWYKVELSNSNDSGWVYSDEVIISDTEYMESKLNKGTVTASVLNVRIGPDTSYTVVTQVKIGSVVTIINTSGEWYEVILSNNMKGWVSSEYVDLTYNLPTGNINKLYIPLRNDSNVNSDVLVELKKSEIVYIKGYEEDFYNVITSTDKEGWVESKYVTLGTKTVNRSGSSRDVFEDIDSITQQYLGKRYAYGATGPNTFDCSGFTTYILKTYYGEYLKSNGITQLPRTASGQAQIGTTVSKSELQKGDLVFFDTSGSIGNDIGHVGIYIGNGEIVHASTSRRQITRDSLSDRYYSSRFMKAIRL